MLTRRRSELVLLSTTLAALTALDFRNRRRRGGVGTAGKSVMSASLRGPAKFMVLKAGLSFDFDLMDFRFESKRFGVKVEKPSHCSG